MAANINDFIYSFKNEVARPCNFDITIIPNVNLLSQITSLGLGGIFAGFTMAKSSHLSMRCEGAELPSRTFALVDQKTYGPVELHPIQNSYDKVNFVLVQEHKYSLDEIEEMIPWEREVYLVQLENHIKAEQMRLEQIKKLKG